MSLHYLLDGYNITNQLPQPAKLEDQRRQLIQLIESQRLKGSPNNNVTIVFDGQSGIFGQEQALSVKVIFSKNETADDKIKKIVEKASNKKNIVVVTDDRDIRYAVGALGAKVLAVKDFLSRNKNPAVRRKTGKRVGEKYSGERKIVDMCLERDITNELKDIWIKKKKNS